MSEQDPSASARSGHLPVAREVESPPLARLLADAADWPDEARQLLGRLLSESESCRSPLERLDADRRRFGLPASSESFAHALSLELLVRHAVGPGWDAARVLGRDDAADHALSRASADVFGTAAVEDVVPRDELLHAFDVALPGEQEERKDALRQCVRRRYGSGGRA